MSIVINSLTTPNSHAITVTIPVSTPCDDNVNCILKLVTGTLEQLRTVGFTETESEGERETQPEPQPELRPEPEPEPPAQTEAEAETPEANDQEEEAKED